MTTTMEATPSSVLTTDRPGTLVSCQLGDDFRERIQGALIEAYPSFRLKEPFVIHLVGGADCYLMEVDGYYPHPDSIDIHGFVTTMPGVEAEYEVWIRVELTNLEHYAVIDSVSR